MNLQGKILAMRAKLRQYGIEPTSITIGKGFHDALTTEVGMPGGRYKTVFGMAVHVAADAPNDTCYMGEDLGL